MWSSVVPSQMPTVPLHVRSLLTGRTVRNQTVQFVCRSKTHHCHVREKVITHLLPWLQPIRGQLYHYVISYSAALKFDSFPFCRHSGSAAQLPGSYEFTVHPVPQCWVPSDDPLSSDPTTNWARGDATKSYHQTSGPHDDAR